MKQLFPRGKRIRPTDKDLVFHTALAALFPVFLLVVLLFHIRQIAGTNWQEVSLSQIVQDVNIPYLLFSMGVAGLVCLAAVLLFWRYRRDEVKQLIHRQKLARMVLDRFPFAVLPREDARRRGQGRFLRVGEIPRHRRAKNKTAARKKNTPSPRKPWPFFPSSPPVKRLILSSNL